MGFDMSRGLAALKSVWSFGSAATAVETGNTMGVDLSGDFLAEAQGYMNMGRHQSAAILAGDALEASLQQLCREYRVALPAQPTVDGMNAKLAQMGVYDDQVHQRLEEMRTLWDNANAGLWSEVPKSAVETMLDEIRAFVSQHVTN
jgi:hypothetical protein